MRRAGRYIRHYVRMDEISGDDPQTIVGELIDGAWRAQVVGAFVRVGCADLLYGRQMTVRELAHESKLHEPTLDRLLRAGVALGLCFRINDQVGLTPAGALLANSHPASVRSWAVLVTDSWMTRAWEHLPDAIGTGGPAFPLAHGVGFWDYVGAHPEESAFFDRAMTRGGEARAAILAAHVDLSDVRTVVDVGGGQGQLLASLLTSNDNLIGVVADRPEVIAAGRTDMSASVRDRLKFQAVDFFTNIPRGADLYVLSRILHDWDDAKALQILQSCRSAMDSAARICILEGVFVESEGLSPDLDTAIKDLNMLVLVGGQERTAAEYQALLTSAQFTDVDCTLTGDVADVILGTAT